MKKNKIMHGLFFCHLTIEKLLKAHFVKSNELIAPKTHDLIYLVDKSKIELKEETMIFLTKLMKFQMEGRYPDYYTKVPGQEEANKFIFDTKEPVEWLIKKL